MNGEAGLKAGPDVLSRRKRTPPVPICASPICGQPCDSEHRLLVRQPERGPWHVCNLACLIVWARLCTLRSVAQPETAEAES